MSQTKIIGHCHPKVQSPNKGRSIILNASITETDCADYRNTVNYISWQKANSVSIEGNQLKHKCINL